MDGFRYGKFSAVLKYYTLALIDSAFLKEDLISCP
jgi:hypothetical protein